MSRSLAFYLSPLTSVLRVWLSLTVMKFVVRNWTKPHELVYWILFCSSISVVKTIGKISQKDCDGKCFFEKKKTTVRPYWIAVLVFITKELTALCFLDCSERPVAVFLVSRGPVSLSIRFDTSVLPWVYFDAQQRRSSLWWSNLSCPGAPHLRAGQLSPFRVSSFIVLHLTVYWVTKR